MLTFDVDDVEVKQLITELGATEKQVSLAFNRALRRTAGTLRKESQKGLKGLLQLRNAKAIRRRLKTLKLKRKKGAFEIKLWFGTNDLAVSAFKGSPRKTAKGAAFRKEQIDGGFIGRARDGKKTIFKRVGKARMPITEAQLPISDEMETYLEDEIFVRIPALFSKYFSADLRARVNLGVGRK